MSRRTRRNPDANFRALKLMIEAEARRQRESFDSRPGFVYASAEELVLEHGRRWPWRPLSRDLSPGATRWGAERKCFANSLLAACFHPDLRYVEGFAYCGHLPVHHAWNVDPSGVVLDFTWNEDELLPSLGRAYMGVVVALDRAWTALWDDEGAVLDGWKRDWPTLREPWGVNDHPPRPTREQILAWIGNAGEGYVRLAASRLAS